MATERILELANAAGQALAIQLPAPKKPSLTARDIETGNLTDAETRWLAGRCVERGYADFEEAAFWMIVNDEFHVEQLLECAGISYGWCA